jgi:hypothetical protein
MSVIALGALVAACETMPPAPPPPRAATRPPSPPPPPPTPEDEFAWSTVRGNNTLIANVFYRPAVNEQWSCAGAVALMPETSYSRGRIITLYGSADRAILPVAQVRARSAANPGADYSQFVKTANCDAQDTFTLQNLPDGAYFAIVRVRQVRPATNNEMVIMQRVAVRGGQTLRVNVPQQAAARPATPPRNPPPRTRPRGR